MQMLMKQATEEPRAPSAMSPRLVPPSLDRVILDCLAKEIADRVQSADELRERLTVVREELPWSVESAIEWWRGVNDFVEPTSGSQDDRGGLIEVSEHGVAP
jgi:serine/threonine-protein kinase